MSTAQLERKANRLTMDDVLKASAWLQSHRTSLEADKVAPASVVTELTAHLGRPISLDQVLKMCRSLDIAWDGGKKPKKGPSKDVDVARYVLLCPGKPIPGALGLRLWPAMKIPDVGPLFDGGRQANEELKVGFWFDPKQ